MRSKKPVSSTMQRSRRAWVRLDQMLIAVYRYPGTFLSSLPEGSRQVADYEKIIDEYGDDVTLSFIIHGRTTSINLTELTSAELNAFLHFITATVERARPAVEARDRIVREVYDEQGEDSFARLYRAVPELFVRAGEVEQYSPSVRVGPPSVADVVRGGFRVTQVAGAIRGKVPELDQGDEQPEDDGAQADGDEGVREVGRDEGEGTDFPF